MQYIIIFRNIWN